MSLWLEELERHLKGVPRGEGLKIKLKRGRFSVF